MGSRSLTSMAQGRRAVRSARDQQNRLFTNLKSGEGVEHISEFIVVKGRLEPRQ